MPKYLTEKQVSEMTGLAIQTLRNDRFLGQRIPYSKIGRSVRYNLDDVVGYMEAHKIRTSETATNRATKSYGCDESGWPLDPQHPWNREKR